MKKNIFVILLTVLCTSCYTYIPIEDIMNKWNGKSEHDVIMQFGSPTNTTSDGADGKVIRYSNSSSTTTYNKYPIINPYNTYNIYTNTTSKTMYMEFFINSNGLVYTWRTNFPNQKVRNGEKYNLNSDSAYFLRGVAHFKAGEFKNASDDFSKALKLNPKYSEAYSFRGMVKASREDFIGAVKNFSKAIDINPTNPKTFYNRAIASAYMQNYSDAIDDLNKAIELKPDYMDAYYSRAFSQDMSGSYY